MRICIVFALCAGLVACGGSPAPSEETLAIRDYTRVASNATHILYYGLDSLEARQHRT